MQKNTIRLVEVYPDSNLGMPGLRGIYEASARYSIEYLVSRYADRLTVRWSPSPIRYKGRASPLKSILEHVGRLDEKQVQGILLKYTDKSVLDIIGKTSSLDQRSLAALLLWISGEERLSIYGKPMLDAVVDAETGEYQFASIVLPNCNADEWDKVVKEIKGEMGRAGLGSMTSKVAIICLQGLYELVS